MSSNLIATHCVVCLVDGQAQSFMPGDALPELPADEAARLVELGAAREAVVEGKAGKAKAKAEPKPKAPAAKGADGAAAEGSDGEGSDLA